MCKRTKIIKYSIITLHFLLSFFFEKMFYRTTLSDVLPTEIEINNSISAETERIMTYCISKLFCLIILYLFWSLVFSIIQKRIPMKKVVFFGAVFIGLLIFQFYLWASLFDLVVDNYTVLAYAVRFLPYYWHHIFTGCLYSGILMIFPNVFSIAFFQSLAFISVLGYISISTKIKTPLLLIFLLPYTLTVVSNPYRNCLYTILCMFYFSYLIAGYLKKEKYQNNKRRIILVLLSAFIAVWRTEGILLGLFGCIIELIFVQDYNFIEKYKCFKGRFRRIISLLASLAIFFSLYTVIGFPQKVGSIRYYGSDYLFISMMPSLQTILNSDSRNLDYDGAKEDLEAIDNVCPINYIKGGGADGYRYYYSIQKGRLNFNQSLVSPETAERFKKAYISIAIHNLDLFFLTQARSFSVANGFDNITFLQNTSKDNTIGFWDSSFHSAMVNDDIDITGFKALTQLKPGYDQLEFVCYLIRYGVFLSYGSPYIVPAINCFIIIFDFILLVYLVVRSILHKGKYLIYTCLLFTLLTQLMIVFCTMPEGFILYFYPFFMSSVVLNIYIFKDTFVKINLKVYSFFKKLIKMPMSKKV